MTEHDASDEQKRRELSLGRHYLRTAKRRLERNLASAWDNDDEAITRLADMLLKAEG